LEAAVPDYGAPELLAAGLVVEPEDAAGRAGGDETPGADEQVAHRRRRYDRFRDRIMFPIRNPRGQVIGFGARVIDAGEPKYLNSPETAVFSKGRELYGVFEAREAIRRADAAVVVEGYMDVVMLAQYGIENAVATLGTATTPQHVHKLIRLADRVTFAFDGDQAGRKAAWRALEASLAHALDTKRIDFLFLPAEHDPDSFVRAFGSEGLQRALTEAQPLSEFLLAELSERLDLGTSEGRARLQAEARPLLLQMPEAALRQQLIGRLADLAGVSVEAVERYVAAGAAQQAPSGADRYDWPAESSEAFAPGAQPAASSGGRGRADRSGAWAHQEAMPGGVGSRIVGRQAVRADAAAGARSGGWNRARGRGQAAGAAGTAAEAGRTDRTRGMEAGRGWRQQRSGPAVRSAAPRAVLDLAARVRLISARYRALADQVSPEQSAWLPEDLTAWLVWLRELPADASFEAVLDALSEHDSEAARRLAERAAAAPAELGPEEAEQEFAGAITELQRRSVRAAIDALIARGALEGQDRHRYEELVGMYRTLSARRMV
ncbi:MAG: DNA primase, partial [Burkholderiales bacterium]